MKTYSWCVRCLVRIRTAMIIIVATKRNAAADTPPITAPMLIVLTPAIVELFEPPGSGKNKYVHFS